MSDEPVTLDPTMSESADRAKHNGSPDLIKIVEIPIKPQEIIDMVKTGNSGCVAVYVGLIRDNSHGRAVQSVEYRDEDGKALGKLIYLAERMKEKWPINKLAIYHRVGVLHVGDINFLVAIATGHRQESFAACAWAVDRFKESLPTLKIETCLDS